jgi:hypothetical protein
MNPWGARVAALLGQCQLRKRPSVPPLLREQTSADCLPVEMCQWRRDLAAVAQATPISEGLAAAERVMGLGKAGPVPVLVVGLAVEQGQGEAELEGVALQPAP